MDEKRSFPRVDDHLVVPEVTRDEIINGHRVVAHPALPPHATKHSDLNYVIQGLALISEIREIVPYKY